MIRESMREQIERERRERTAFFRHAVLLGLVFGTLLATGLLHGCSSLGVSAYAWAPDDTAPYCEAPTWKQVAPERIPGLCSYKGRAADAYTSCTIGCVVISRYSAEQAKHIEIDGLTLYEHEASMHAQRRLKHQ